MVYLLYSIGGGMRTYQQGDKYRFGTLYAIGRVGTVFSFWRGCGCRCGLNIFSLMITPG